MKRITVLTGAGISAESGIQTFRDADGLWAGHDIMEVASPEGWNQNKELVLDFYNKRRKQLLQVNPNSAHLLLASMEKYFDLSIITQNIDDLHERAGSKKVIHLHGELLKVRSTLDENLIYKWEKDLTSKDICDKGSQLRPYIVWFGEAVPMMDKAIEIVVKSDILIIIGTSMQVYPAAGLIQYIDSNTPIYFIDPNPNILQESYKNLTIIPEKASSGMEKLMGYLKKYIHA